ncbi:MAG TPA: glycosyltransferase family A protein, partial [Allosphingosinicella sp.]|nr:glycosyltransferase family A protein [Allosphingosinicella sp.]
MKKRHVEILKKIYKRLPPRLRGAIPAGLDLWLRDRLLPGAGLRKPSGRVQVLESKLWGGYSRKALADLEALVGAPKTGVNTAVAGALALARWHALAGDFETALDLIRFMRERQPARARDREQYLREALFLCRLGRAPEARALLEDRLRRAPFDVSAELMMANAWNPAAGAPEPVALAEAQILARINAAFAHFGLGAIAKHDPGAALSLDNLRGARALPAAEGPKVTVIVPLWNAEATIGTALRSLAEQTYENLEVLVVDDLSTDASADVVADFARSDPRFRLIRQSVNGGSYAARNRALVEATGEFVTVHDADDWSHPERIARHAVDLASRDVPFNISAWVRTTPEMLFIGNWRPMATLFQRNFSSVFFRRALIDKVGTWDAARISADGEFVNRVQKLHGLRRQRPFLPCPLAFGRIGKNSLTQTGRTHVATIYHGLRREYHEAGDFWHAGLDPAVVLAEGIGATPPYFPAPLAVRSARQPEPAHDLLIIGD